MKITEIRVAMRFTKNLGNYESFVAEAGLTAAIDEGDSADASFRELWQTAKSEIRNQIVNLKILKEDK